MAEPVKCLSCNGKKETRIRGTRKFEKCVACNGKGFVVVRNI